MGKCAYYCLAQGLGLFYFRSTKTLAVGYHVIILKEGNQMEHTYVESYEKLAYVSDLSKDSIIYEGESHWKPVIAGTCDRYKHFAEDWFRAGIKAQDVFWRQANEQGYMLETIKQDQESFKSYINKAKSLPIKRGDFLIRDAGGIEIDIKCRTFYRENGERYFNFSEEDFCKHINMISLTNTPVIIGVYERLGDGVKEDQFFMFEIKKLEQELENITVQIRDDVGPCFKIPLGLTKKGFRVIEKYRK